MFGANETVAFEEEKCYSDGSDEEGYEDPEDPADSCAEGTLLVLTIEPRLPASVSLEMGRESLVLENISYEKLKRVTRGLVIGVVRETTCLNRGCLNVESGLENLKIPSARSREI